ncbi:energy transducer TonB [Abyssalbus ytuae]|uniref:Energy transducer TonB n=1 Tax=Abyssalbus ytuae TaxID=2926907 RepID=A0A9E7CYT1_9FLAO|nr:energy transducer TonB [Abyssalbus ytuae]UOB16960.1 energy transducer TonB [Abyssalbus ytuae]
MELKKNPKVDLNRNSGLYFSFGLCFMLFVTWMLLEMKSYDKDELYVQNIAAVDEYSEEIPITTTLTPPPPPPPPEAPAETIEVVADEVEIEETILSSTETNQDEAIPESVIEVEDVEVGEAVEEDIYVPFAVIEEVPIFPGCEGTPKELMRKCFVDKVQEHIRRNFRYPPDALQDNIQGKVFVQFTIDQKGNITDIKSRAPHILLQESAEDLVASLPKMTPGKQRGQAVKVNYSLPVIFKLVNQ